MKIDAREAARLLSVSETDVYRWAESGELPCYRVNHQPRFARGELLEWATERRVAITRELLFDDGGAASSTLPETIELGGVYRIQGSDDPRASLREFLDQVIPDPQRETLLSVWMSRTNLGATLVGEGIAIPKVRRPVVIPGSPAKVVVGHFAHPVGCREPPIAHIRTLVVIVSATMRAHLELLARLSRAVEDSTFMSALKDRLDRRELAAAAQRVDDWLGGEQ